MSVGIQTINANKQIRQNAPMAFKAQTTPVKDYPPDTVEIGGEKKTGMSTGAKVGIGLGIIGAAALAIGAIVKGKGKGKEIEQLKELEKLYKDKLVKSQLPEHIEFKEASTVEEAIKWTKETFGIKEIDNNFSLEAINDTNRCLTNVSNRHKGNLYVPRALKYQERGGNVGGEFVIDINDTNFGTIIVNSKYYDEKWLDETLRKELYKSDGKTQMFAFNKNLELTDAVPRNKVILNPKDELAKLINTYYKDPENLTLDGKRALKFSMIRANDYLDYFTKRNPLALLKEIKNYNYIKQKGIEIDIASLEKQPHEKVVEYTNNLLKQMLKDDAPVFIDMLQTPADQVFYHEMGHLQDIGKNWQDLIKTKHEIWNRYGTLRYFKNQDIEAVKNSYPAMKEFIENNEIQNTASKVSNYAREGIGEFVAEVYSDLIWGRNFSDDVMALYKKYNGPLPDGFK